jgi:hypothetical protein
MNVSHSDSKTVLKLQCDCCTKFQLFEDAQDVVTRLMAVCCMLLPHNPNRLPQHYKRHVCEPSYTCKHRFLWISLIFEHQFCLNSTGTVHHWQPFWSTARVCFIGPCWYLNPQWTAVQGIIKVSSVRTLLVSWKKCTITKCLHIYQCLWRGLGIRGGTFWLLNENLAFKGPEA